jgi:hypothetical protein
MSMSEEKTWIDSELEKLQNEKQSCSADSLDLLWLLIGFIAGSVVAGLGAWFISGKVRSSYEQKLQTTMSNTEEWTPVEDAQGNLKKLIVTRKVRRF